MKKDALLDLILPNYSSIRTPIKIILGCLSYVVNILFRGTHESMYILLMLQIVDVFSGFIRAYVFSDLSSCEMKKGIARKVLTWTIIIAAAQLSYLSGVAQLKLAIIYFFIGSEMLSIIENAALCGIPVPDWLKDRLREWNSRAGSLDKQSKDGPNLSAG